MSGLGRLTSVAIAGALAIGTSAVSPPQAGAQSVRGARSAAQEAGVGAKPPGCDKSAGARKARCYLAVQPASGCAGRSTADVSAVAANVLSYDTYQASGWYYSFGTSVSSPVIAGAYGLADNPSGTTIPASAAYSAPAADLHDITKGSTGTCTPGYLCKAGKGYDGPTGLGAPHGIGALPGTRHPGAGHLRRLLLRPGVRPLDHRYRSQLWRLPADRHAGDMPGRGYRRRLRVIGAVVQRRDCELDGRPGW